jgi:hypothetical protein
MRIFVTQDWVKRAILTPIIKIPICSKSAAALSIKRKENWLAGEPEELARK